MPGVENLAGVEFFEIAEIEVGEFHPLPDGQGDPTQVHMRCRLVGIPHPFIIRLKSARAVDELIVGLMTHRNRVWPPSTSPDGTASGDPPASQSCVESDADAQD